MKKFLSLCTIFLICSGLTLASQENDKRIDKNWINLQKRIRVNYEKRKLFEMDKKILDTIAKKGIQPEVEGDAAVLLYDIIFDNMVDARENAVKVIDIFINTFTDKKYFFNYSVQYTYSYASKNPFVIERIIQGLNQLLEPYTEMDLNALELIYNSIKTPYIVNSTDVTIKYGTNIVIGTLVTYIRSYIRLLNDGKIKPTYEKDKLIGNIYQDLGLEQGNFNLLEGTKELMEEYFMRKTVN